MNRAKWLWKAVWIVWTLFMCHQLLKPGGVEKPWWYFFDHIDLLIHIAIFMIWSMLATLSIKDATRYKLVFVSLSGFVLAGFTEYLQNFIPNRSGDWLDFCVDLFGIAVGISIIIYLKKNRYHFN